MKFGVSRTTYIYDVTDPNSSILKYQIAFIIAKITISQMVNIAKTPSIYNLCTTIAKSLIY